MKQEVEFKQEIEVEKEKVVLSFDIETLKKVGAIVDKKPVPCQIIWEQNGEELCVDAFIKKKSFVNSEKLIFGEQSKMDHVLEMISDLIVDEKGKNILSKEILNNLNENFLIACVTSINKVNEKKS